MKNKAITILLLALTCGANLNAKIIKVLAVGNSFSVDAVENYLYDIGKASGDTLIIGNMYIGGCSLERHWTNAITNAAAYSYRKINEKGVMTVKENTTLIEALTDEAWDFITSQQVSQLSGQYDTYFPYATNLLNAARTLATNPNVKFVLHMTWAYAQNSTHSGFANYNNDQQTMYEAIVDAATRVAATLGIDMLIPSGTAIQNGRTSYLGDSFCRDGYHLEMNYGRYTAACTWYEMLTGKSVLDNAFFPVNLTPEAIKVARQAAHDAVLKPDGVTDNTASPIF